MTRASWSLLLLVAVSGHCFAETPEQQAPTYRPTVGQLHPNFVLPRIEDDAAIELKQFHGRKLLLIHFASW